MGGEHYPGAVTRSLFLTDNTAQFVVTYPGDIL
ncbi:hypothetical protein ES703_70071 [subsurface metagenome]